MALYTKKQVMKSIKRVSHVPPIPMNGKRGCLAFWQKAGVLLLVCNPHKMAESLKLTPVIKQISPEIK